MIFLDWSCVDPVVVVPSTFCIGENGVPLEVIGGPLKPADLVSRIQQVQQVWQSNFLHTNWVDCCYK